MRIISFIEDREVIQTILKHHPHYIPGMLTFSRKDQEYGAGGTGVPG